jgi:protein gp37
MSDLFHEAIPEQYIQRVFEVMGRAYWHSFQILTKRSGRLAHVSPSGEGNGV